MKKKERKESKGGKYERKRENTRAIIQESWNPWTYSRNGHREKVKDAKGTVSEEKGAERKEE